MHSTRSSGEFVPEPVLSIRDLVVEFGTEDGVVHAVDGISYDVFPGETLGIVGESGSGKSVSTMSILGLIPQPPGRIASGTAMFKGKDLLKMKKRELRRVRGDEVAMIFQDPMTSLNPVLKVGYQLGEAIKTHYPKEPNDKVKSRVIDLLRLVGVPNPESRYDNYPHEFSGGMRQRAMIAMSIANSPSLLIADEPTTALDVTIQAGILDLIRELRERLGTAIILITHDLGVVAEMCDRVAVMYAGEIVEQTDVTTLFRRARHPYTRGLIGSIPVVGDVRDDLSVIPGNVPNLIDLPKGCRFAPRCASRVAEDNALAIDVHPGLHPIRPEHDVRCWLYHDVNGRPLPRPEGWVPRTDVSAEEVLATGAAADAGAAASEITTRERLP